MKKRPKKRSEAARDLVALVPEVLEEDDLDKQTVFAVTYLRNGFNATRAAQAAGYSGDEDALAAAGSDNLRKPKVREIMRRIRADLVMDAIEALHRLAEMGRTNMAEFLSKGNRIDLQAAREAGKLWLVKKLKQREYWQGSGVNAEKVFETTVELYDAQAALKLFLQFHGLLEGGTRGAPKEEQDIHEELAQNILRVHGKEKGVEIVKALGLRVTQAIH